MREREEGAGGGGGMLYRSQEHLGSRIMHVITGACAKTMMQRIRFLFLNIGLPSTCFSVGFSA